MTRYATMMLIAAGLVDSNVRAQDVVAEPSQVTSVDPVSAYIHGAVGAVPRDLEGHDAGARERAQADRPVFDTIGDEWFGERPWWTWSRATGDWGGARTRLEELGFSFAGSYVGEWSRPLHNGIDPATTYRHLIDVNLTWDLEPLTGLAGATAFADFYTTNGRSGSADVGDAQGFTNLETARDVDELAELWYQQWLIKDVVRLKIGKVDANTEFAFADNAGEFVNSSFGVSPTVLDMPTYPDPATGVNLFAYPTEWLYAGVGLYDGSLQEGVPTGSRGPGTFFGEPSDLFLIGEVGVTWHIGGDLHGRLGVGGWHHTGTFDRFDAGVFDPATGATTLAPRGPDDGASGFYLVTDQAIWRELPTVDDDPQGAGIFLMYGWADPEVSLIEHHVGGGLSWTGLLPSRDEDVLGLGASYVRFSDEPGAGLVEPDELTLEAFYKLQLTSSCSVKPDLQYIIHPGGAGDDALVGALRLELAF
jgi:porin